MDLVPYAVPFFVLAMLAEMLWGRRRGRNTYRINDAVSSLFLGSLSQARRFITLGVGGYVYHWVATHVSIDQLSAASVWTWIWAMVLYDFCYYWLHRLGHERAILWAAHVAHHQSEDYNLSTALRQTSTGFLLSWVFYVPMFVLGIPAEVVVTVGSINLIYQFWVHTEHVGKLGCYEWFFVTPSNHRVHHAQNTIYLDRNYGGLLIVWDRLFGTYQEELDHEPPVFGIRGALHSWNPLKALSHIYVDMVKDSWRARRWRDKVYVWVARTGWRPADLQAQDSDRKAELADFVRYDPKVSDLVKRYALFQLFAVVALLGYMQVGIADVYLLGVSLALAMLLTAATTACWLEGRVRRVCLGMDLVRLMLLATALTNGGTVLDADYFSTVAWLYLACNLVILSRLAISEGRDPGALAAA